MTVKKFFVILLLTLSIFSTSACSQAAEEIAENIIEDNASGNVDVDLDDDNISITDGDGNEFQAGDSIDLPSNWPSAIPPYDGNLTTVSIEKDGAVLASWNTSDSLSDAYDAYSAALEAAGFTLTSETTQTDYRMITYESDTYSLLVTFSVLDGVTTVGVIADKL